MILSRKRNSDEMFYFNDELKKPNMAENLSKTITTTIFSEVRRYIQEVLMEKSEYWCR